MVTLITRPNPPPVFRGTTGAERAAKRAAFFAAQAAARIQPTKETRQNYRAMLRKADKMAKAAARKAGVRV